MRIFLTAILILTCTFCNPLERRKEWNETTENNTGNSIPIGTTSWSTLLEDISKYNGDTIAINGFFQNEFEDVALYKSRNSTKDEALWLDFNIEFEEGYLKSLDKNNVYVYGILDSDSKGHLDYYSGTIKIISIDKLSNKPEK